MKSLTRRSSSSLLVIAALVVALAVGACSRSGVDSVAGPSHTGAIAFDKGRGNAPPPAPAPPPANADPCVSLTGFGGALAGAAGSIPQNRATRLRVEITGDLASNVITRIGGCATSAAPTVTFTTASGSALGRTVRVTSLAAVPGEPGVLLGSDAAGNVLEVIWPALAGLAAGPPILRMQFVTGSQAGRTTSATMSFTARTANGATATFTASAANLVVPALR